MTKVDIEIFDSILTVLNKIKNINDSGIELNIPEGSVLFENVLNLKLLEKEAEKLDKTLHLNTKDKYGITLIKMINEDENEFIAKEDFISEEYDVDKKEKKNKMKISLPTALPKIPIPKINIKGKSLAIFTLIVGVIGFAGYMLIWNVPKAKAKIVVNSQPLIKSVQIKTVLDGPNSAENKTINGYAVQTTITKTGSQATTGEKLIGKRAKGTIKIYNRTDTSIEFKKGLSVTYKDDDKNLEFTLDDSVNVDAETLQDPLDPTSPSIPGEATVKVTAKDIGKKYNINNDETLEFEDYKKSEVFAITSEKFSGGKSETILVVTEEDQTALSTTVFEEAASLIEDALNNKTEKSKKYIKGSSIATIKSDLFNAKVGDEIEKIELTQEITATGMAYSKDDLEKILDEILKGFIPDGFMLSTKEKEINVEVLGNSDETILSNTEADLQVTIKSFVIPKIEEDKIKEELLGKSIKEAQKILGGIRNVNTYELTVSPNIPFFQRLPQNSENIEIEIERE